MRRDELYLNDIVEAAAAINDFLKEVDRDEFMQNDLVRSAVLQKLTIIGEAAARLQPDFRKRQDSIEWGDVSRSGISLSTPISPSIGRLSGLPQRRKFRLWLLK